jgi:hypothetical protein
MTLAKSEISREAKYNGSMYYVGKTVAVTKAFFRRSVPPREA